MENDENDNALDRTKQAVFKEITSAEAAGSIMLLPRLLCTFNLYFQRTF